MRVRKLVRPLPPTAVLPTSERTRGARPAADSGYPPDGLTSLCGSVCVGIGGRSGGGSGRSGCRWIDAPCNCRWRSGGRGDMWVVGGLWGAGSGHRGFTVPGSSSTSPVSADGWRQRSTLPLRGSGEPPSRPPYGCPSTSRRIIGNCAGGDIPAAAATTCWGCPAASAAESASYQCWRAVSRVSVAAASFSRSEGGCHPQPHFRSAARRRSGDR